MSDHRDDDGRRENEPMDAYMRQHFGVEPEGGAGSSKLPVTSGEDAAVDRFVEHHFGIRP